MIIQALNLFPKEIIKSIKELNSLRNRLSHKIAYDVTKDDMEKILKPMRGYRDYKDKVKVEDFSSGIWFLLDFIENELDR